MDSIISINNLVKSFYPRRKLFQKSRNISINAVNGISFNVSQGDFLGYLGPNGAGKSTTIKMLTGLLAPTSGSILVDGFIPWKERTQYVREIGTVFGQKSSLWWDLPVTDSFEMIRYMYNVSQNTYDTNINIFRKMLGLDEFIHKPIRTLSLGQRMRAELSAALLYEPKILFLDEPTIGLDLVAKDRIRTFLSEVNQTRGTTILLTTHDLSDVEKLCRSIIIIDQGNLVYQGSLIALAQSLGGKHRLIADIEEDPTTVKIEGADIISIEGKRIIIEFDAQKGDISSMMQQLTQQFTIRDIEVKKPEIEQVVREIYEKGNPQKQKTPSLLIK